LVITQLAGLAGAPGRVTPQIDAGIPDGAPDNVVRAVTGRRRVFFPP